jgi:ABC-type lipopolysaccharide export system ATPase subunit
MATAKTSALKATGLRKSFGDNVVLDGIDLDIAEVSVFSLLGPNGAGKTTAVRIFSTLIAADEGQVRIGGFDLVRQPEKVRSVIGVTGQFSAVDNLLSGAENLMLMADLHHLERGAARRTVDDLLYRFDLADAGRRMAATYSGGMRRRLDLCSPSSAAPSCPLLLCPPASAGSPATSRSHRSSRPCGAYSLAPPSATKPCWPWPGPPPSVPSASSGPAACTTATGPNDRSVRQLLSWDGSGPGACPRAWPAPGRPGWLGLLR